SLNLPTKVRQIPATTAITPIAVTISTRLCPRDFEVVVFMIMVPT
ncbi:MAG: hypothetical protein ACI9R3_005674, partial [Verrucomicrobiales bacterium]